MCICTFSRSRFDSFLFSSSHEDFISISLFLLPPFDEHPRASWITLFVVPSEHKFPSPPAEDLTSSARPEDDVLLISSSLDITEASKDDLRTISDMEGSERLYTPDGMGMETLAKASLLRLVLGEEEAAERERTKTPLHCHSALMGCCLEAEFLSSRASFRRPTPSSTSLR